MAVELGKHGERLLKARSGAPGTRLDLTNPDALRHSEQAGKRNHKSVTSNRYCCSGREMLHACTVCQIGRRNTELRRIRAGSPQKGWRR